MTLVCTICARAGSEGVAGKNVRPLLGKPLIAYTIERAREAELFDLIAIDSDGAEIREAAMEAGADVAFDRPAEMASSRAGKLPVIARAARLAERHVGHVFDAIVDLDATSPLRAASDIVGAVAVLDDPAVSNVISVTASHRSPYFNLAEESPDGVLQLSKPSDAVRRQDAPPCFDLNASIYVWRRSPFIDEPYLFGPGTRGFEMPRNRSIDIDSELDFRIVEMLMKDQTSDG